MVLEEVAAAIERVKAALRRRPGVGIQDDSPVTVRWDGGTRTVAHRANGARVATDMPRELGGSGGEVTPDHRCAPISGAVASAPPVGLRIDVEAA